MAVKEDNLKNLDLGGLITIASRMKRLYELLFVQVQDLYDLRDRGFKASWFAILATIKKEGQVDFKTLADRNNISASAVSQTMKELENADLVVIEAAQDRRSRIIRLTKLAEDFLESVLPDLIDIENVLQNILTEDSEPLIKALSKLEKALKEKTIIQRLNYEIIPFDKKYKNDFLRLNLEWLESDFVVEEIDKFLLEKPEEAIIDKGGEIFFVLQGNIVVATLALKPDENGDFEMSKMTVIPKLRRNGIAQKLLEKAIEFAKTKSAKRIFAYTSSKLRPANFFYKINRFTETDHRVEEYGNRVDKKFTLELQ